MMTSQKSLKGVKIIGVGGAVPPTIILNEALTQLVDTSDEWITSRTGIKQRHVLSGDETLSDLGVAAGKQAIAQAGIDPATIGMIIVATTTPDERYPAMAARVQVGVGAVNASGYDVALACTGFAAALITAEQFLRTGFHQRILVVGADAHTRVMDWSDRNTCVLFGDGAGAVLLESTEIENDAFLACDMNLDGSKAQELHADHIVNNCPLVPQASARSPYVQMNGREVYKFAVAVVMNSILRTLENCQKTIDDIDYLILHQANIRIMESMTERLGIPPEKMIVNLQRFGNTSAATIPLALNEAVLDGRIKTGSTVMICGFGGGLSWASSCFRWGGPTIVAEKTIVSV